ncbi:hypothetical protein [Leptolyngbya sp. ST-U4]|uniref:hypothetical protein n=1 Tax=Leptolyngbya sp. ST-U4 TaxID=2933912 RepID=UPI003299EDE2
MQQLYSSTLSNPSFIQGFTRYVSYRIILKTLVVISIVLVILLSIPNYALAAPCSNAKLANNLKNILVEKISIPVSSTDISEAASFKKMKIYFSAKTGGTIETGSDLNLTDLKDVNGYALVDFRMNKGLKEIPIIKSYLQSQFADATDLIRVSNVYASLVLKDANDKEIASYAFKIREGRNEVPICEFGKLKQDVKSIHVKVNSFDGDFSVKHSF